MAELAGLYVFSLIVGVVLVILAIDLSKNEESNVGHPKYGMFLLFRSVLVSAGILLVAIPLVKLATSGV